MREGPGVVRGVAGPDQVTALARRPAPLTGQLGEYPVEDRRPWFALSPVAATRLRWFRLTTAISPLEPVPVRPLPNRFQ